MSYNEPTDDRVPWRITAEYQFFGERVGGTQIDAAMWFWETVLHGQREGLIQSASLIHVAKGGIYGLQLVIFEAELMMYMKTSQKALRKTATKRLNKMVNDTDVDVRWIQRI